MLLAVILPVSCTEESSSYLNLIEPSHYDDSPEEVNLSMHQQFLRDAEFYEGTSILHISDIHEGFWRLDIILDLAAQCGVELVVNTGDETNAVPGADFAQIAPVFEQYRASVDKSGLTVLGTQGNHDAFCTREEYRSAMVDKMTQLITDDGVGAYGYYDFQDIRIVLLDPRDATQDGMDWWIAAFSQKQIDWLIAVLDDARKKNLGVITAMHYAFGDNRLWDHENVRPDISFCQNPFMIPTIINAMQSGEELHTTFYVWRDGGAQIDINIPASEHKLDYIAHLYGHLHSKEAYNCAKADGTKDYHLLMLGEASLSFKGVALDRAERVAGTDTDIAASLLKIDRKRRMIHRISYGAHLPPQTQSFSYGEASGENPESSIHEITIN